MDWDCASDDNNQGPIVNGIEDQRYPGAGSYRFLLTASQIIIVVFQLSFANIEERRKVENVICDLKNTDENWWSPKEGVSLMSNVISQDDYRSRFHRWVKGFSISGRDSREIELVVKMAAMAVTQMMLLRLKSTALCPDCPEKDHIKFAERAGTLMKLTGQEQGDRLLEILKRQPQDIPLPGDINLMLGKCVLALDVPLSESNSQIREHWDGITDALLIPIGTSFPHF